MQTQNPIRFLLLGKLLIAAILCLTLTTEVSAQEGIFTLEKSEQHLSALDDIGKLKREGQLDLTTTLEELRKVEQYSQSLADFILSSLNQGGVSPYVLNLVAASLKATARVHLNIQTAQGSKELLILKALQLESFKKIHDLFFHKKSLRSIVKDQVEAQSLRDFERVKANSFNKKYIRDVQNILKKNAFPLENPRTNIEKSWTQSGLYRLLEKEKNWDQIADQNMFWRNVGDGILGGLGKITTGASAAFGAVAGNIAWREGYLKNDSVLMDALHQNLKPFDILMEKKAYKFTDITIPGHWGHAGVYLGTEAQLRELGLWELEEMKPFREGIQSGKPIFQVRRWGLEFDSLENFSNLDEIAILRVKDFTNKDSKSLSQTLNFLSDQIGKGYDFSFDAMTGETITCTEIVAFSYGPIRWPMETIMGRLTISPNDLAKLAFYTNSPLETILYVTGDERGAHFKTEEAFGKTLDFHKRNGTYQFYKEECERTRYRHRSGGTRFKYSCEDTYTEMNY